VNEPLRPPTRLEVDPHAGECTLSYLLCLAIKGSSDELWQACPTSTPTAAVVAFFQKVMFALREELQEGGLIERLDVVEARGICILGRIAQRYRQRGGHDKFADVIDGKVTALFKDRLREFVAPDATQDTFRPEFGGCLDRSIQLFERLFASVDDPRCAPAASELAEIVVTARRQACGPVWTAECKLFVGYWRDATSLARHAALPLYFFHELMSHLAPRKDLGPTCSDGWLMEAAKMAWERLRSEDALVHLEMSALAMDAFRNDQSDSFLAPSSSPYSHAARNFYHFFPQLFWPLTLDFVCSTSQSRSEALVVSNLKVFLVDGAADAQGSRSVWVDGLRQVFSTSWLDMDDLRDRLAQKRTAIETALREKGFEA
jgi:hypothetical protein